MTALFYHDNLSYIFLYIYNDLGGVGNYLLVVPPVSTLRPENHPGLMAEAKICAKSVPIQSLFHAG